MSSDLASNRPRPAADRSTSRVQAASERIQARRRKSARRLWGVATMFCIVGLGTAYAVYADARAKEAKRHKQEDFLERTQSDRNQDQTPVIEISHAWDAREQRWRDRQRTLRSSKERGYDPETRQRANRILDEVHDNLLDLAAHWDDREESDRLRLELEFNREEWDELMTGLPAGK